MMKPIIKESGNMVEVELPLRSTAFELDMRRFIPGQRRDRNSGTWIVDPGYLGILRVLLQAHFGGCFDKSGYGHVVIPEKFRVLWEEKQRQQGRWSSIGNVSPHAVLFVTADAPIEVVRAAYRALAKKFHPDAVSGDGSMMRAINEAYNAIEGEYDKHESIRRSAGRGQR